MLELACAGAATAFGAATVGAGRSAGDSQPPGVAWQRTYDDLDVAAVAPAHDGGEVLVGRGRGRSDPDVPVRVAVVDEDGAVRQRTEVAPEIPEDARRASVDVIRTADGYAVATGSWFATLSASLSVETTGFASEYEPNSTTRLVELSDGVAVASELDRPNHVSVRVFGFDDDGELRWTREYGEWNSKWLGFLLRAPDGGLVVGGGAGDPWLASLADDGSERWQTTVTDVPAGVGADATSHESGFTLFGESSAVGLTASGSVEWQRSYDAFADTFDGKIASTTDDGYLVVAPVSSDVVRIGKTDARGRLQWSHEYAMIESGDAYVNDVLARGPGEFLVVGSRRDRREGWAVLVSEDETPTTRATTGARTTTGPRTTTQTDGGATSDRPTDSTRTSAVDSTSSSVPGFGIGAALVGTAAGLLARRRR